MEKFFKVPINFEKNENITIKDIKKDTLIGEVHFNDMLSTLNFTKEEKLFSDPVFLTLQLVANINSFPILKSMNPELIPLLFDENTLNKFKGTPLFYFIKGHINEVREKTEKSIKKVNDFDNFFKIFLIYYSIVISKGIMINLNNKPTLCLFPIMNKVRFSLNKEVINCKIELNKDNKFIIKSIKDIEAGTNLFLPFNLTDSFEYNFIKYGLLPDSFTDTNITLVVDDNLITLSENMKDDDKIILRRIRKNPKYKDLKKKLKNIFDEKINELTENKTEDKPISDYIKHVLKLYKNNYPK